MASDDRHATYLREWADGLLPLEAATELLIRVGFAGEDQPWVRYDEPAASPWIAFDEIPDLIGGLSGGEKRLLMIAASLAGDASVVLGDAIAGLDRRWTELVMVAIAHAAGFSEFTTDVVVENGTPTPAVIPPLAQWPSNKE